LLIVLFITGICVDQLLNIIFAKETKKIVQKQARILHEDDKDYDDLFSGKVSKFRVSNELAMELSHEQTHAVAL
jgi:hypothetical protein